MYAALLTAKGGHIAAANAAAAAAAVKDDHDNDADDDTNAHAGPPPVVTSRGRVGTARGGDELLKEKKLNPDGSFGDPLPRLGSSSGGNVPQPWVCPRPDCGRNNFQWRKTCPHCGSKRPDPGQAPANVTKGEDAPAFRKPPVTKHDQDREERSRPAAAAKKPAPPPAEVARGDKANANLQVNCYATTSPTMMMRRNHLVKGRSLATVIMLRLS